MKKLILALLLTAVVGILFIGCSAGQRDLADWKAGTKAYEDYVEGKIIYVHDEVHEVGIWYVILGGRYIFVLPDREYLNAGENWP